MKKLCLCGFILTGWIFAAHAEMAVSFQPTSVALGESAQLIFRSDEPIKGMPNLSALQNNFTVSGQQQRIQAVNINGQKQVQYELIFNVFPRKEGKISTGSLTLDGQQVGSAILNVSKGGTTELPISFQASVNTTDVYPDETVFYTIRLSDGAGLLGGQIIPPDIENAQIVPLDMDKTYQEHDSDGMPIHIFERTFAIIPEKAGYLTIPPAALQSAVADSSRNNSMDLFGQGLLFGGFGSFQRDIRLETNHIQITVRNKPADWQGWWLPSTQVVLSARDDFPDAIHAGDSLSRTIRLTAIGVEAERLPTAIQPETSSLKIYPSPEQRETIQTPVGDIQGVTETSVVMVPVKNGELVIPEIRIPWFNTKTHQTEEAVLPAKTIHVTGETPAQAEDSSTSQIRTENSPMQINASTSQTEQASPSTEKQGIKLYVVVILVTMGVVGGLLLGMYLSRRKKRKNMYERPLSEHKKKRKEKKPLPDLYPF